MAGSMANTPTKCLDEPPRQTIDLRGNILISHANVSSAEKLGLVFQNPVETFVF